MKLTRLAYIVMLWTSLLNIMGTVNYDVSSRKINENKVIKEISSKIKTKYKNKIVSTVMRCNVDKAKWKCIEKYKLRLDIENEDIKFIDVDIYLSDNKVYKVVIDKCNDDIVNKIIKLVGINNTAIRKTRNTVEIFDTSIKRKMVVLDKEKVMQEFNRKTLKRLGAFVRDTDGIEIRSMIVSDGEELSIPNIVNEFANAEIAEYKNHIASVNNVYGNVVYVVASIGNMRKSNIYLLFDNKDKANINKSLIKIFGNELEIEDTSIVTATGEKLYLHKNGNKTLIYSK